MSCTECGGPGWVWVDIDDDESIRQRCSRCAITEMIPVVLGYAAPTEFPCLTVEISEGGRAAVLWLTVERGTFVTDRFPKSLPVPGEFVPLSMFEADR